MRESPDVYYEIQALNPNSPVALDRLARAVRTRRERRLLAGCDRLPRADGGRRRPHQLVSTNPPNPWDLYAPFYDWENARTMGRRDLAFWKRFASQQRGRSLELGCGTGRLLMPLTRAGARVVGIDLSREMLAEAATRASRMTRTLRPGLIRGDIRAMPFADGSFARVMAPYGVLQSLMSDDDLQAALREAHRVLKPGGRFGVDLVPDLKDWRAYQKQVRFRGTLRGKPVTLIESVRQRRSTGVTVFDEEFQIGGGDDVERRRFSLTFRTVPMEVMLARVTDAGFEVDLVAGTYAGGAWTPDAAVWLLVGRRPTARQRPRAYF